jgi:hypothetical protein
MEGDSLVYLLSMSCLFRRQFSIYFRRQSCLQTTHEEGGEEILLDSLNCSAREVINGKTALYRLNERPDSPSLVVELFELF